MSNGGLTLTISQGATAVLQIQLTDTISGAYTVTQLAAIDHPVAGTEDNLQFTVGYVATDGDGDTATGSLSIDVDDDRPTVSANLAVQLDDDALGGNAGGDGDVDPDTANTTGTLAHSYGADGAGTTLLTAAGSLLPAGFTAVVSNGGLTLTISQGATAVLQIQLTDTISGAYTVTQLAAIDHPVAGTEDNLQFTVGYVATDGDGDTATGSLSIDVDDDTPTAAAEASQDVPEGTTVTGTLDFAGGADGATVTHIDGTLLVFNPADADYSQAIDIGFGLIKVKADGSYSFTADAVTTPVPRDSATYTVTDGDGDTATATIDFQVVDANTPTPGTAAAAVDDDGLAGGNPASTTRRPRCQCRRSDGAASSEATFSGMLGGSVGARRRRLERLLLRRPQRPVRHGRPGERHLQLDRRQQHADRHHRRRHTARHGAVHGAGHQCGDGRLHGDAARQRAARPGPERRERRHRGAAVLDHRRRRLDRQRHADRHLRRRCADRDGGSLAERGGRRHGDRHAGLRRRRRRRHGDPHRVDGAGVQPGRRQLLAGDRHRRRLHQGEGRRQLLVHRRQSGPGPGVHHLHGDGRRRRHGAGGGQLRRRRRQPADRRHGSGGGRRRRACRRQSGEHDGRPAGRQCRRRQQRGDVLRLARRQRRRRRRRLERLLLRRPQRPVRHGRPGERHLQLERRQQHADRHHGRRHTARHGAVHGAGHRCGDGRLYV